MHTNIINQRAHMTMKVKSQGHNARAVINHLSSFAFYISIWEHASIGFAICTYIINQMKQNVTYFVGQMWVKRAQFFYKYISQCIGPRGSSLIRTTI